MQILILNAVGGAPDDQHILLAPKDMAYPDETANRIIRTVAENEPDLSWDDVRKPLLDAGFMEPSRIVSNERPWDESRMSNQITFSVQFPVTAKHEYAGKTLTATNGVPCQDGKVVLIDEEKNILTPDDRPWDRQNRYLEQVPLGPVHLPDQQFPSPKAFRRAARLLQSSGFELANKLDPADAVR